MLDNYVRFLDEMSLRELHLISRDLRGIRVLHVNSTSKGGGVAEILSSLVPLMNELGVRTDWKVIEGDNKFFNFTKKLHNLLHYPYPDSIESNEIVHYFKITYYNSSRIDTENYDVVFIHDPQPMGLIVKKVIGQKWIWRCHIDTSTPNPHAWRFIENFINAYDACVFHIPEFVHESIRIPTYIIPPSIDPLHPKNAELLESDVKAILEKFGLDLEKPIITQVSRFDKLKDPFGVVAAFKVVRKKYDCQLVLLGSCASDDPEGEVVYKELVSQTVDEKDIFVLNLPPDSHLEVNAVQRGSTVVVQKSIKEGFGLVVSEAMWKMKPVVGSNVGGIKEQILDGITGYLVNSVEGTAVRIRQLLSNPELIKTMGIRARERVRHRFLITRHLRDYLLMIKKLLFSSP
ncbi:MAG: glycosyltransferase [Thermosulfidibacteraceae bacterium]